MQDFEKIKAQVSSLVLNGLTAEALEYLNQHSLKLPKRLRQSIMLNLSRLNRLKEQEIMGLVGAESVRVELAQINKAILSILDELEDNTVIKILSDHEASTRNHEIPVQKDSKKKVSPFKQKSKLITGLLLTLLTILACLAEITGFNMKDLFTNNQPTAVHAEPIVSDQVDDEDLKSKVAFSSQEEKSSDESVTKFEGVNTDASNADPIEKAPELKADDILLEHAAYGLTLIYVEGGRFKMGSAAAVASTDEGPLHEVELSSFFMSKTELRVAQYRQYCIATGTPMPDEPKWGWQDDAPIVGVTWHEAVAFCDWLSRELELKVRLPTEAEWEYAAKGGQKSKGYTYSGSEELAVVARSANDSTLNRYKVATKAPNELGFFDMSGNVLEWCSDWYDKAYYENSPMQNPKGPDAGVLKVLRGGSWNMDASFCRVTNRSFKTNPLTRLDAAGFRLVVSK
jgi:sulfatase modifying factor 1